MGRLVTTKIADIDAARGDMMDARPVKLMLGIFIGMFLLGSQATYAQSSNDSAMVNAIKKRGTLRVAVDFAPPNLMFNSKENRWEGVFPDLVNAWAKELGVRVEYQQTTFANMVASIQAARADLALDLTVNEQRKKGARFSVPVRSDIGAFIFAKRIPGVTSFEQLNTPQHKVCTQEGGVYDMALKHAKIKINVQVLRLPSSAACFAALDSGRVDAAFWGWSVAAQYAKANAARGAGVLFPPVPLATADIANAFSLNYSDADAKPLNTFTEKWIRDPNGLPASLRRWNASANPLHYAIGMVPAYVKKAAAINFGPN